MRIFLFLLAIILLITCTPKEEEGPLYLIEQSTKDYLVFPMGSYWIYEEESTGIKDSLYLYREESKIVNNKKVASYAYQRLDLYYFSSLNEDTILKSIDKHLEAGLDVAGEVNISSLSGDYVFFNRGKCIDSINLSTSNYLIRNCNDSLHTILGREYKNCILFFEKQLGTLSIYSKEIGIIKRVDVNGKVWNLKKYFINK
jgi:hypothetical protein